MKVEHILIAVLLVTVPVSSDAETIPILTDESLISSSDYCLAGTVTADGNFPVLHNVFGSYDKRAINLNITKRFQPGQKLVLFLVRHRNKVRCPPNAFRIVQNGQVYTSDVMSGDFLDKRADVRVHYFHGSAIPTPRKTAAVLPTAFEAYVEEVRNRAAKERKTRLTEHKQALDILFNPSTYLKEKQNIHRVRFDLLDDKLSQVHADDEETLRRIAHFIKEHPEQRYHHARERFVCILLDKYFIEGFDAIRLEASRNSHWSSQRTAIWALGKIGTTADVQLLKQIIANLIKRKEQTLLRAAFPVAGKLVNRVYSFDSAERKKFRLWLERFCEKPTDQEKDTGCHVYAAVALGTLGHKESLPLIQSLNKKKPNKWYQEAMSRIQNRTKAPKNISNATN